MNLWAEKKFIFKEIPSYFVTTDEYDWFTIKIKTHISPNKK